MPIDLKADMTRNVLYFTLEEFNSDDELQAAHDEAIELYKKMKPGFVLVSDARTFKPASPEGLQMVQSAQAKAVEAGLGRVIRIVSQSALSKMQLNRSEKGVEGYKAEAVTSPEEAEELLNQ
ncbi:MAG: hypothetical protein JEZ06_03975 [Anaerolineaceae bacterium]|nr:hypothetical protein [Anaerolineaceae bacterium]